MEWAPLPKYFLTTEQIPAIHSPVLLETFIKKIAVIANNLKQLWCVCVCVCVCVYTKIEEKYHKKKVR
jgi:hypothetical protein